MSWNTALWIAQILLAIKLFSATYTHGIRPDQVKMQRGFERFDRATRPVLSVVAVLTFLGGVGLIVPSALGVLPRVTTWTAALVEVMMLLSAAFHTGCREKPRIRVSLILCVLAAFVAYGRWVQAPF